MRKIDIWATNNGLCINPTKSKCILIHRSNRNITNDIQIKISSNVIEFVSCSKNLGVIFNSKLTWSNHIASAVGKIYGMLRNLWAVKCSTPFGIRMVLVKTYTNCDANDLQKLKVSYNNIARYVFNRGVRATISVFSQQICNMYFENLLKFICLIFLHKIIYTAQPTYLYGTINFGISAGGLVLIQRKYKTTFSERQFFIYCTRLWNQLPKRIQIINNANRFKI